MADDALFRTAVDRLVPPEPPSFFEDFWQETSRREHEAAQRWRRVSLVLAACTVAALAAAGVIAAPFGSRDVVDQTLTCSTQTRAGYHTFAIAASPTRPPGAAQYGRHTAAQVIFTTGADWFYGTKLLQLDATLKGSLVNKNLCASSGSKLTLAPNGLPLRADYVKGSYSGRELQCLRPGRITFRSRVTFDANGAPIHARIAVEMTKTHSPVLYADWSPTRARLYGVSDCRDTDF
jgi:hypothetical protein